jgi:hypothetical protein
MLGSGIKADINEFERRGEAAKNRYSEVGIIPTFYPTSLALKAVSIGKKNQPF